MLKFKNYNFEGVGEAGEHKEGWVHNHSAGGGHQGSARESAGDFNDIRQELPNKRTLQA